MKTSNPQAKTKEQYPTFSCKYQGYELKPESAQATILIYSNSKLYTNE